MRKTNGNNNLRFVDLELRLKNKVILQNVNGEAKSGQLLAVLGPSGSGKTTFLDALSGRLPLSSGRITLNGRRFNKRLRRNLAYVLQTDIFLSRLTLWETLYFTAMVQIPDTVSKAEQMYRVNEIVQTLDLKKCLNTVVGDALIRGLSGGEKKRLNIACELLSDPDIVFLDEPTSGLDSTTARHLIDKLWDLARNQNKIIITTLHQPSSYIYHMFSSLLLLVDGQTAYFGAANKAIEYFSAMGFHCMKDYNPADYLLQLLSSDKQIVNIIISSAEGFGNFRLPQDSGETMLDKEKRSILFDPDDPDVVLTPVVETDQCEKNVHSTTNTWTTFTKEEHLSKRKWPTSFRTQFQMLTWRNFKQSKGRQFNPYGVFLSLVFALCIGLVYFQIDQSLKTFRERMGMIFFCVLYWGYVLTGTAVIVFLEERAVVSKDRSAGMYRLSAYYAAKTISELPQILGVPTIFLTLVYWMVLLGDVTNFFVFWGINVLNCLIMQSVGHVIGALMLNSGAGPVFAHTILLLCILLGGFYNTNLPQWFDWVKYLSPAHYTFSALVIAILKETLPIRCNDTISQYTNCTHNSTDVITPEQYLENIGIDLPVYFYLGMMCVILLSLKLLCYFLLRLRVGKI